MEENGRILHVKNGNFQYEDSEKVKFQVFGKEKSCYEFSKKKKIFSNMRNFGKVVFVIFMLYIT